MTKPTKLPEWATVPSTDPVVGGDNIVEPPEQLKQTGWLRGQYPPANYMNWLQNLAYQWLEYLDVRVDEIHGFGSTVDGLGLVNNATNKTDILPGSFKDIPSNKAFTLASTLTKEDMLDWEEGDQNGGFPDALTQATDTFYHKFMLAKLDGTIDSGVDSSLSAVNLLADPNVISAGYTIAKRVGTIYNNSSSQIDPFVMIVQKGKRTYLWNVQKNFTISSVGITPSLHALSVPPGLQIEAIIGADQEISTTASDIFIYSPLLDDFMSGAADLFSTTPVVNELQIITDTSAQIKVRGNVATSPSINIRTKGWNEYL